MSDLILYVVENLYCSRSSGLRQHVMSWCILG